MSPVPIPDGALRTLCQTSKTFLGVFAMICVLLAIALYIADYFVNSGKPKSSKKPLLWVAATSVLLLAAISIVIYIIAPPLLNAMGVQTGPPECQTAYQPNPEPPYCGDYCTNRSAPKSSENCTCLLYAAE